MHDQKSGPVEDTTRNTGRDRHTVWFWKHALGAASLAILTTLILNETILGTFIWLA